MRNLFGLVRSRNLNNGFLYRYTLHLQQIYGYSTLGMPSACQFLYFYSYKAFIVGIKRKYWLTILNGKLLG